MAEDARFADADPRPLARMLLPPNGPQRWTGCSAWVLTWSYPVTVNPSTGPP